MQEDLLEIVVDGHALPVAEEQQIANAPSGTGVRILLPQCQETGRDLAEGGDAVLVGAHVRARHFILITDRSSTLMVLVLPVPGSPQMRLNLLLALPPCTAVTQLSMAPACESLSPTRIACWVGARRCCR